MTLSQFRYNSTFVKACADRGSLNNLTLSLIDVGCSGGISSFWLQFGTALKAVGFDPLISEIERLNREVSGQNIRYIAAYVDQGAHPLPPAVKIDASLPQDLYGSQSVFSLSSAQRALEKTNFNYTAEVFNRGAELHFADRHLSLDEWLSESDFGTVDVIKCDTDGFDFEVFIGCEDTLSSADRPLALITEASFHEALGKRGTVFGDLDRYFRDKGYRLFSIDSYCYTRGDLPGAFAYEIFGNTLTGQAMWCDALYMLDPVMDEWIMDDLVKRNPLALLKLVLFYESFGLPDCAASLLVKLRERGLKPGGLDPTWALDQLVPPNPYGAESYDDFISAFDANPYAMLPSYRSIPDPKSEAITTSAAEPQPSHLQSISQNLTENPENGWVMDWTAEMCASQGSIKQGLTIISPVGKGGHFCYGPYKRLPAGTYTATLLVEICEPDAHHLKIKDLAFKLFKSLIGRRNLQKLILEVVLDEETVQAQEVIACKAGCITVETAFEITPVSKLPAVQLRLTADPSREQRLLHVLIKRTA